MISIITCLRPTGVSYLGPLIGVIDTILPGERRVLICDGPAITVPNWETIACGEFRERRGIDNKFPGWVAIEAAFNAGVDLLFLEDDVRPVDEQSLRDAVAYEVPAGVAYSSLHRSCYTTPGVHRSRKFMMSQAVKIPARSIPWLLQWRHSCWRDWEQVVGVDNAIAEAGGATGWLYEQTERNYFDHVGDVSAVRPGFSGIH